MNDFELKLRIITFIPYSSKLFTHILTVKVVGTKKCLAFKTMKCERWL